MKRELLTVLSSVAFGLAANALPKVGETLHGFELKGLTDLPDAVGRLWQMEYVKTAPGSCGSNAPTRTARS